MKISFLIFLTLTLVGFRPDSDLSEQELKPVSCSGTTGVNLGAKIPEDYSPRIFYRYENDQVKCSPLMVFSESAHRRFLGCVSYDSNFVRNSELEVEFQLREVIDSVVPFEVSAGGGFYKKVFTFDDSVKAELLMHDVENGAEISLKGFEWKKFGRD